MVTKTQRIPIGTTGNSYTITVRTPDLTEEQNKLLDNKPSIPALTRWRKKQGLTIKKAADMIGVAPTTLRRYEEGIGRGWYPTGEKIRTMALVTGLSCGQLLELEHYTG